VTRSAKLGGGLLKTVRETLAQGYQISPDAMAELEEWKGDNSFLERVIKTAVEAKERSGASKIVELKDLVELFPDSFRITRNLVRENLPTTRAPVDHQDWEIDIISSGPSDMSSNIEAGFAELFRSRYEKTLKIFMQRPEARQLAKVSEKGGKGSRWIAGLLMSKREVKSGGGLEVTVDDDVGSGVFLALSEDCKKALAECTVDECVMLEAMSSNGKFLVKKVLEPDIPNKTSSTSKKTVYVAFLSDLHIGSNKFLEGAFDRFLRWLQDFESDEVVRRLKYVVLGGDIVDGVGVFPNQEYELEEVDIVKQYQMVVKKLSLIPKGVRVFVLPGNHDATRQALPQPVIPRKYAGELYDLENVTMLGDPCFFKLNGVSVLSYHGRSLDDVLAVTPGLSYQRPTEPMRKLLKARHLAPIFGSRTPIAPDVEDHLVIDEVPDIFHSGHVHTVGVERYKSTLIINSGTWQGQTGFQANMGINPTPGLVPLVNLSNLEVTLKEFLVAGG
jgi:DNA polymerase II small subunit